MNRETETETERERERERGAERTDERTGERRRTGGSSASKDSIASELRVHADNELQVRVYYLHMTRIGISAAAAAVILSRRCVAIRRYALPSVPQRRCCIGNGIG